MVFNNNIYYESFNNSSGSIYNFGIGIENWFSNDISGYLSLNLLNQSTNFEKLTSYPIFTGENLNLKNNYNLNLSYLTLSVGLKYNFYNNFNVHINLERSFTSFSNHVYNLEVKSPDWYEFKNNSKKEELFNDNVNTNNISIVGLGISYNIELSYPFYITPVIQYSRNINSIFDNQNHYINSFQIGVNLYYGISNLKLF